MGRGSWVVGRGAVAGVGEVRGGDMRSEVRGVRRVRRVCACVRVTERTMSCGWRQQRPFWQTAA